MELLCEPQGEFSISMSWVWHDNIIWTLRVCYIFLHWCTWVFIPKAVPCHFLLKLDLQQWPFIQRNAEIYRFTFLPLRAWFLILLQAASRPATTNLLAENGMSRCKRLFSTRPGTAPIFTTCPLFGATVQGFVFSGWGGLLAVVDRCCCHWLQAANRSSPGALRDVDPKFPRVLTDDLSSFTRPWFLSEAGRLSCCKTSTRISACWHIIIESQWAFFMFFFFEDYYLSAQTPKKSNGIFWGFESRTGPRRAKKLQAEKRLVGTWLAFLDKNGCIKFP